MTGDWFDETNENTHLPFPVNADGEGPVDEDQADHWVCMVDGQRDCPDMEEWMEDYSNKNCPYYRHVVNGEPFGICNRGCWEEPRCLT